MKTLLTIIILLTTLSCTAQTIIYRRYTTDINGKTTSTIKGVTDYVISLEKATDSLKTVLTEFKAGTRIDTSYFSQEPIEEFYELAKAKNIYYHVGNISPNDSTVQIIVRYWINGKKKELKLIDNSK